MGVGQPLDSLVWLGEHGCPVAAIAADAAALVSSYQDSPGRAAMLAALERFRGK
jgi:hypothetical protein